MAFKAGNQLVSVAGEGKPVFVWKRKCNRPGATLSHQSQSSKSRQRTEKGRHLSKSGERNEDNESSRLISTLSDLQERQQKREMLYDSLDKKLAKDSAHSANAVDLADLECKPTLAKDDKIGRNQEADCSSSGSDYDQIIAPSGDANMPESALITEVDHINDVFNHCAIVRSAVRPLSAGSHHNIEKHSKNIVRTNAAVNRGSYVKHGLDKANSSADSQRKSILERLSEPALNSNSPNTDAEGTAMLPGSNHKFVDHESHSVVDYGGSSSSEADDAPHRQQEVPLLMKHVEGSSGISTSVKGRPMQRPASARASLQHHYRHRKEKLLDEMRVHLHKRVRARKEKSIVGDDIFQRQMKSGFWTSEVLYHQWGNNILSMRNTWKENTSQEFVQSFPEEPQQPIRLRARRQAICVDRDKRSPLTMNTMTFMAPTNEEEPSGNVQSLDARRRSSNLPAYNKERSYSVDQGGLPIRFDLQEDAESRKRRLRALFKDTIIKVYRITTVMMHMIEASKAGTYSGLMASLHFSQADGSEDPNSFNKEHYSRKYAELHVPRWAKQIAAKEPWERTPEEIIRLYGVMRNMRSFEKFTRRMRMEICRAARYNECGKGRVIVRQGHVGFNFYFIFSGSVFVQLDILDESSGVMTTSNVNTLMRGSSFGELALLSNGQRTASVICRENTEIFEIEKETFLEVCPDIFDNELAEKIKVANELPFFKSWPEDQLRRLCFESPIQEIDFGKVVETNPGTSEYCYVVLEGKVSLLKECDLVQALTQHCKEMMTRDLAPDRKRDGPSESSLNEKIMQKLKALLLPEWTKNGKCHMSIGLMSVGHATDLLPIKFRDREQLAGVTLVSRGCRTMRVTKQRIEKMAPRGILDTFRQKHSTVLPTPSNEELFERFLVDVAWRHYRTYVTKGSTEKLSRGTGSTKSMWLANYLVTNALLRDKRGRLAVKERLKEIQERHHRKTEDEEDEEENKESEEDQARIVHLNKLRKGTISHTFSKIEEACNI
eukprot:XP_003725008.1 PREDICTED: uncharacterized protein LOC100893466 [Strongylocentrotus purpuratus]